MPHEKHPPKSWYRVVVLLKREWTNVDHNLGGRRAFELVQQWREASYMAHYVNLARKPSGFSPGMNGKTLAKSGRSQYTLC